MLSAKAFAVASFVHAQPLSLILPYKKGEAAALIGCAGSRSVSVFLEGHHAYRFMDCEGTEDWVGLLIPNIALEIDVASAFDPNETRPEPGNLVRSGAQLSIVAMSERSSAQHARITLEDGLSSNVEGLKVAFRRWQVVLGDGVSKQVLWSVGHDEVVDERQ